VEWNTSEWVGKTAEIVLEDDSTEGALVADEFVAFTENAMELASLCSFSFCFRPRMRPATPPRP
jgi:hypothetical protein